ncbi:hypothetical protein ACFQL1_17520 [Halomicroarcula sp. GCM10025709]|uniref:hypothetical protein n=1 Tax=Haloarcula TaxID=2237 RepID=UPI0024C4188D|nr:hypothetical protein [Halomicroarcula sp. YJ-61-S]
MSESPAEQSVGLSIPEEYAGEFVAEVFEDAERSTDWPGVVDAFVPPARREEWGELDATAQVCQVLDRAGAYDQSAVDALERIDADAERPAAREKFDEAIRCRHNADGFRNAVADAYARGRIDDDGLVAAVERTDFGTDTIARREELLELIAEKHEFEFRPYGGTLLDGERFQTDSSDSATW